MPRDFTKIFKRTAGTGQMSRPEGAGNFDNMDDRNFVKSMNSDQGTIQHTPTADKDIVNKLYVDGQITGKAWLLATAQIGLTGNKTGTFSLTTTGNCAFGNVEPFDDDTYYLGHQSWRWKGLFLSGDATIGGDAIVTGDINVNNLNASGAIKTTEGTANEISIGSGGLANIDATGGSITFDSFLIIDGGTLGTSALRIGNPDVPHLFIASFETADGGLIIDRSNGGDYVFLRSRRGTQDIFFSHIGDDLEIKNEASDTWTFKSNGDFETIKNKITNIGGIAILLTNKTGANSVAGKLVRADTSTNDAAKLTVIDEEECFGVFLDSGVSDGSEAWIVISGIADVAMENNTTATRGNWVRTSTTVGEEGYADATNAAPPSPAAFSHFNEIGNCIETVTATGEGTHVLARCVLHFN